MEYKIIVKKAFTAFRSDFERPAEQLAAEVNEHIERGWEPQGGVGCGQSRVDQDALSFSGDDQTPMTS